MLAIDAGSTGVRALVVDASGAVHARAYREVLPQTPGPGLVEHDPETTLAAAREVLAEALAGVAVADVRGIGITTQRGTAVVWDPRSGRAVHPAISWQDGRSAARCEELLGAGVFVSPFTAAPKIEWILDRVDPERRGVGDGTLRCGTLDAWLACRLTSGRVLATDASNASCSGFYDVIGHDWSAQTARGAPRPRRRTPADRRFEWRAGHDRPLPRRAGVAAGRAHRRPAGRDDGTAPAARRAR